MIRGFTLCYAITLPARNSGFRDEFRPDSSGAGFRAGCANRRRATTDRAGLAVTRTEAAGGQGPGENEMLNLC